MKKATMFVLAAALTVSLAGCSSSPKETEAPKTEATTEAVTEKKTEAVTEKQTEAPTEKETEAPTETETEKVTEAPTEAETEKVTEAPTEAETETETETEAVTEKKAEAAPETETETGKVTEAPTEAETETEEVTEAPTEAETETEEVTEAPTEAETETEEVTEAPTEAETETEEVTEVPTEAETETEEVTEAPTEAETETEEVTEVPTEAETVIEEETEVLTETDAMAPAETEEETEVPTEAETETEEVTEAPTEAETETEEVTEAPTEAETETEEVTEAPTEAETETEEVTEAVTEPVEVETEAALTVPEGTSYKAAFLIPGTLGDKSFWDSGNEGLTKLKDELGEDVFDFKVEQMGGTAADMANYEPTFLDYCDMEEYDVIITGSWQCMDALLAAIDQYPDQKFILFDEEFDFEGNGNPENIYNVLFKQNEVSYLVGAAAAQMSESGTISFLGGMDGKVINDFLVGYIQGAADTNPDIRVAVSMVGNYEDSAKGKDLSLAMYNAGADFGFNVAGNAGLGLIEAAAETGKYAFGVDSDQAALLPDYADSIPTSALKNVGTALYRAIAMDMNGELGYGTKESLGFAENGVALVEDAHYEEMVPEEVRASMDELEQKITDGEITVYTSAGMTTDEIEELKASVAVK